MNNELLQICKRFNAQFVDIRKNVFLQWLFDLRLWRFRYKAFLKMYRIFGVSIKTNAAYGSNITSEGAIVDMYDIEYNTSNDSHYMYLNALLYPGMPEYITGYSRKEIQEKVIADVGAGSNELLRFFTNEYEIPQTQLHGTDISMESVKIITNDGFYGYRGRLENISFPKDFFDILFLSYFIDYDINQEATLKEAVRITKPGGKIILEGKFPCKPLGLLPDDQKTSIFITKGNSVTEDIILVCNAFLRIGQNANKKVQIDKIIRSRRYIYNRMGLRKLSSFFLVISIVK